MEASGQRLLPRCLRAEVPREDAPVPAPDKRAECVARRLKCLRRLRAIPAGAISGRSRDLLSVLSPWRGHLPLLTT